MTIILRKEKEVLESKKSWIFVYGRRKTGKSFLVKNWGKWDEYFYIKRDRTILTDVAEDIPYKTLIEIMRRELQRNKTIVIDEFHRLGNDLQDTIHSLNKEGRLILISSTLFLSKKLLGEKSPILGLFAEMPIKIIDLSDTLNFLKKLEMTKKELVENAIILREPTTINNLDINKIARKIFATIFLEKINAVPALIGEIFLEEEKTVSGIYEGILRAISNGNIDTTEIKNCLLSKTLIDLNNSGSIHQYLKNLVNFGIIKKIKVHNRDKYIYKHTSPLVDLFYYADEKYNITEILPSEGNIELIINEKMPKIVEDNIREFLAQKFGLSESVIETKDYDIDCCLLKFNNPEIIAEIKWKNTIDNNELKKIEENLNAIKAKKKYLFVQDKDKIKQKLKDIEIVDIKDFI